MGFEPVTSFQLLKLDNLLRWSFFTFIYNRSSKMNYFIYTSHHFTTHARYELNKLTSLPMCRFIAQLVEQRGGHGFESRWSPDFFFRLLLSNCLNWKIYCYDHSSLSVFGLFCYSPLCDQALDHGFGSPCEPHQLPCRLCAYVVALPRATFNCSLSRWEQYNRSFHWALTLNITMIKNSCFPIGYWSQPIYGACISILFCMNKLEVCFLEPISWKF